MAKKNAAKKPRLATEAPETDKGYEPTEKQRVLIDKVSAIYKEKDKRKTPFERIWFVNHAAILGQHNISFNRDRGTFETPARSSRARTRAMVNLMKTYYMRTLSRMSGKPAFFLPPQTTDQVDVDRAELGQHVLESEVERLKFRATSKEFVGWCIESNGLLEMKWNPFAGPALTQEVPVMQKDPATGAEIPMQDPETGQPVMQTVPVVDQHGRQVHRGEVEIEPISPFEFDVDPDATDLHRDAKWCQVSRIKSLSWIRQHYPKFGRFVEAEDVYVSDLWKKRHRNVAGATSTSDEAADEKAENSAVVIFHRERPSEEHPDGYWVVVANDVLLHEGPHPYPRMLREGFWCNIVHSGFLKVVGRLWFTSLIEDAFPINRLINKALSQSEENRAKLGNGIWLQHDQVTLIEGSLKTGEAGEIVKWSGPKDTPPVQVTPQATSQATDTVIQLALKFLEELLAWHEPSRGISPGAGSSGKQVGLLQQADDSVLGVFEDSVRDAYSQVGRMILSLVAEFWTEDRLARRTGEDGRILAKRVSGKDIDADEDDFTFDVRVAPQSVMTKDPAEMRAQVDFLIGTKLLMVENPAHREIALKILQRSDLGEIFKDEKLDSAYACDENQMMQEGTFPVPQEFEDHDIHIREHDRFRKSDRYRSLPDERKQLVDAHVEEHYQLGMQKQVKIAQIQTAIQLAAQPPAPPPVEGGEQPPGGEGGPVPPEQPGPGGAGEPGAAPMPDAADAPAPLDLAGVEIPPGELPPELPVEPPVMPPPPVQPIGEDMIVEPPMPDGSRRIRKTYIFPPPGASIPGEGL